jgi:type II secretory pathway pseudopilin PulG
MTRTRQRHAGERGFTLAELLIGMVLTLVVTGGALLAFQQAVVLMNGTRLKLQMDDNVRLALDLMVRDLIQTGDGLPNGKTIPVPNGNGASRINRPGPNLDPFPTSTIDIGAVTPGPQLGPLVNGVRSDVISVLHADTSFDRGDEERTCTMAGNGRSCAFFHLNAANQRVTDTTDEVGTMRDPLLAGDLLMITASTGGGTTLVMVTSVTPATTAQFAAGDAMNLNQPTAPDGSIDAINPNPGNPFDVTVRRVRMITYWVQSQSGTDRLELMRQMNMATPQRVASGIERLLLTYDLVDGVNNPTDDNDPDFPNQIRKVNITLAARSADRYKSTNEFVRTTMSTQVSLRSLALVDRYL